MLEKIVIVLNFCIVLSIECFVVIDYIVVVRFFSGIFCKVNNILELFVFLVMKKYVVILKFNYKW